MTQYLRQSLVRVLYFFVQYLQFYTNFWQTADMLQDRNLDGAKLPGDEYFDFIVIGAGTAGSVVANRLSLKYRVLLLEEGGERFPLTEIPSFALFLLDYPAIDWMHRSIPQDNACLALHNNESGWSQGRGLGGTSNLNFLIHSRGHPKDYQMWAKITGDSSWNYEGVLPFFKKSEDFHGEHEHNGLHGKGGPMNLEVPPSNQMADVYLKALAELGYPNVDVNGNYSHGFDKIYCPIKRGRRQSAFNAYLKPIRRRNNLTIRKFAQVNKVLLRGEKNEAYGVEFERHGKRERALAHKEIILSAGIQSPKILMLSGIGNPKHLESVQIETKVNSPQVGQNLQDHISLYLGPFFTRAGVGPSFEFDRDISLRHFTQFAFNGQGPLSTPGLEVIGFLPVTPGQSVNISKSGDDWPNIQYIFSGINIFNAVQFGIFARAFHLRDDIIQKYYAHAVGREYFFVIVSLARPEQRGEILLKSSNPREGLHIDPKYFQNPQDVATLIAGIKTIVDGVETAPTFKKLGASYTTQAFPGCEKEEYRSDLYWECFVRQYSITLHHIVGTCAMTSEDKGREFGVVDPKLRVMGTEKLRVIDASVMPRVPIGNTNAPTVMIGEKGADMILQQWT